MKNQPKKVEFGRCDLHGLIGCKLVGGETLKRICRSCSDRGRLQCVAAMFVAGKVLAPVTIKIQNFSRCGKRCESDDHSAQRDLMSGILDRKESEVIRDYPVITGGDYAAVID